MSESKEMLQERQLAAMRFYVGQTDKIDGEFDPTTCTIKRPEGYEERAEAAQPEPEPADKPAVKTAAQKKAEKNRKKREQKKRAKLAAKGKDPDKLGPTAVAANGWTKREVPVPHGPNMVRPEKPKTQAEMLREMGFGRREREKLQTFERLTRLTGLVDEMPPPEGAQPGEKRAGVNQILQELVQTGGNVDHIHDARHNCARLTDIAMDLVKEVDYIMKYPEEANGRDVEDLRPLRDKLNELVSELSSRAGEPELMKTEAAERMRQKLEKKLLPKLQTSIPKWAEQLRFMHADVLKWSAPEASQKLVEQERAEREAAAHQAKLEAEEQAARERTWTAPEEVNPAPDDEELRVLQAMGWSAGDDIDDDVDDSDDPIPETVDPSAETADPLPQTAEAPDPLPQTADTVQETADAVQETADLSSSETTDPAPAQVDLNDIIGGPDSAILELEFRRELGTMKLRQLRQLARAAGISPEALEDAMDTDDPEGTLIDFIVENSDNGTAAGPPGAGVPTLQQLANTASSQDDESFKIDPTNEFVASPGLDSLTRKLKTDNPGALAGALFLLAGADGLRVPWGDAQLMGGIAAQGQFQLLRRWGFGAPLPEEPDPNDTCSGNQQVVDEILGVLAEHDPDADDGYSAKSEAFDTEVIEGDGRQKPLTHEEVHKIVDQYAGVPRPATEGGEIVDPMTAPRHKYRTEAAHQQAIEAVNVIREARNRGASDLQLLTCFRLAAKQKVRAARQAEQEVIRKEGLSETAGRLAMQTDISQQAKEKLALSQGFSAAEVLAAREEGLDLVGTKKVLEAIENTTPPNWRVLDAARFAKQHKEETDAEQYIFTDEARTLMTWDLGKIARHAMALGIDPDYIADVMRPSSSYGSIEEPDALPDDDNKAKIRRQMHLRSETVQRQTQFHEQEGDDTVNVQSAEWELVGPIVSQSKGIHHHLRFLPIPQLVKRAEEVGVPKKERKVARKDRSALCKAILAHRFQHPKPVEFWTGGLGVKQRDPFAVQEKPKAKAKGSKRKGKKEGSESFGNMLQTGLRAKPEVGKSFARDEVD